MIAFGKLLNVLGVFYGVVTMLSFIFFCILGYLSIYIDIKYDLIVAILFVDSFFIFLMHFFKNENNHFSVNSAFYEDGITCVLLNFLFFILFLNLIINFVLIFIDTFLLHNIGMILCVDNCFVQVIGSTIALLSFFISVDFLFGIRKVLPRWLMLLPDFPLIILPLYVLKKLKRKNRK